MRSSIPVHAIVLIILAIVIFEGFQQDYYISTYSIADPASYTLMALLKNHLYRWLIWCVTAYAFYKLTIRLAEFELSNKILFYLTIILLLLVSLDIFLISIMSLFRDNLSFTRQNFVNYFEFYTYQKGPTFTVAYLSLGIFTFLSYKNKVLSIKLMSLLSAKDSNVDSYHELHEKNWNDETKVLNVRIGKKVKLIPIPEIDWIESDNYCVKIHTSDSNHYTLRSSMNKLEELLPKPQFIRTHRRWIVNSKCINEVVTGSSPKVILSTGEILGVASSRISDVNDFLANKNLITS